MEIQLCQGEIVPCIQNITLLVKYKFTTHHQKLLQVQYHSRLDLLYKLRRIFPAGLGRRKKFQHPFQYISEQLLQNSLYEIQSDEILLLRSLEIPVSHKDRV